MARTIELKGFVMEELHNINNHFREFSPRIELSKYHKEIATLRKIVPPKIITLTF